MPHAYPRDFLRTTRRAAGLSQHELTRLMGLASRSHLSRIERGKQALQLDQAIRYELLFGVPMTKIAPAFCGKAINGLWENITAALDANPTPNSPHASRKRQLLTIAQARIEALH